MCYQQNKSERIDQLHEVIRYFSLLPGEDITSIVKAGQCCREFLENKSVNDIIKIGMLFKQYTSMEWYADWEKVKIGEYKKYFSNESNYIYLIILGSFHPNGYFREYCLIEMQNYQSTLPYILYRLNDWVLPIQSLSYILVCEKVKNSSFLELCEASVVLIKLKQAQRREVSHFINIENKIYERLLLLLNDNMTSISQLHLSVKIALYKLLLSKSNCDIPLEKINQLLQLEKTGICKNIIIRIILQNYNIDVENAKEYLNNKNSFVRKEALYYIYEKEKNIWQGVESFLLDTNRSIREFIRYILKKHSQLDILAYYIEALPCASAIVGIGECGSFKDHELILPYLYNTDIKTVKNTIQALSKLMNHYGKDIYWEFLLDNRKGVCKASYLAIQYNHLHYGAKFVYNTYACCEDEYNKAYLLKVLCQEDSWERLPYLLEMYWHKDLKQRNIIQRKVNQRDYYKKLNAVIGDQIISIIQNKKYLIPKNLCDDIQFDLRFVLKK